MQGTDKLLVSLLGRPLLDYPIRCFQGSDQVDEIILVLRSEMVPEWRARAQEQGWHKVSAVVAGGGRRQDSVSVGLTALKGCHWAVIHDGARPCVTKDILIRGLEEARETGAAVAGIPSKDTVKLVGQGGLVSSTVPRDSVWLVQTPQVFSYDIISKAYLADVGDVTDDAALVERTGCQVKVYMGADTNIKVTTPEDLELAKIFLGAHSR